MNSFSLSKQKPNTLILTGGGSGGHAVPIVTLYQSLPREKYKIVWIGSAAGIEKDLAAKNNISFIPIPCGKLERTLTPRNVLNILRFLWGTLLVIPKLFHLKKSSAAIHLFSTGGYVSLGPVIASSILKIPSSLHEQTSRCGLANSISSKFVNKIFISFNSSTPFFPKGKTVYSGYPVRPEFYSRESKEVVWLRNNERPLLLITGGGNGSGLLNEVILKNLNKLIKKYTVIHQVGKLFYPTYSIHQQENYIVKDFIGTEWVDLLKMAHVVICRAGAGTVSEIIASEQNAIFVPLSIAQQNEQFHNATEASLKIGSLVLSEIDFKNCDLAKIIEEKFPLHSTLSKKNSLKNVLETDKPPSKPVDFLVNQITTSLERGN